MHNIILKNYSLLSNKEHEQLLSIRNFKEIRENSLNEEEIDLKSHLSWVKRLGSDSTKLYFAVFLDEKIVGGVNLFNINTNIRWGIFLSTETPMLIKSIIPLYFIDYLFAHKLISTLFADIKKENANAISYNQRLGFQIIEEKADIVVVKLDFKAYCYAKKGKILKKIIKKMNLYNFEIKGYNE
jgi:RimJ/RimL family protein N-acetyltransferase